jgi:hypothetical protein
MRIVIFVDKDGSAIDRLAKAVQRNLPQHQIQVFPVHPKRNDIETMAEAERLMMWADVIDIHYWKSGKILRSMFPSEFEKKPRILFHFNPYDAENEENKFYDRVVVGNVEIYNRIPSAVLIPYGVDLSFFKFNDNYTTEPIVNMSVNRIEGKKGVLEVAQACKQLGYKFRLIGRVSKGEYMSQVMEAGRGNIEFWENATDEKMLEVYYSSAIHVCNSVDGYESGTLPILENMAVGVPVLTRMIGHVTDLYDGGNMAINPGKPEDLEQLKFQLKSLMDNVEYRERIREKAWDTIKNRDDRRMAQDVNKLYYDVYKKELMLTSVIVATKDNPEAFVESLVGILKQDYPKMEIVIADSGDTPVKQIINSVKKQTSIPIRYIYFPHKDNYTLAEARNRAIVEADGQLLVFCDDRIKMKPNAVSIFVNYRKTGTWLWGMKDKAIKGFVENFSCVARQDLINHGMFCERMQWYGGMTQEIRERFEHSVGLNFVFIQEAEAESIKRAKSKKSRRENIVEAKYLIYKMYNK